MPVSEKGALFYLIGDLILFSTSFKERAFLFFFMHRRHRFWQLPWRSLHRTFLSITLATPRPAADVIHAVELIEMFIITEAVDAFPKYIRRPALKQTLSAFSQDQGSTARFCPAPLLNHDAPGIHPKASFRLNLMRLGDRLGILSVEIGRYKTLRARSDANLPRQGAISCPLWTACPT